MYFLVSDSQPSVKSGKAKTACARAAGSARARFASQQGNAIFQVIFVLAILIVAIYFISDRVQGQRKIVLQTGSVLKARFALQSLMDYTYFAIQRRYCFSDTLLADAGCSLKYKANIPSTGYGRSIERVLLSDEQGKNMVRMINTNNVNLGLEKPPPPVGTNCALTPMPAACSTEAEVRAISALDLSVHAKDIPSTHPLFPIVDPLYQVMRLELKNASKFKNLDLVIRVKINREDGSYVPRTGNEVYFTVKVALEDGTGKVLTINNTTKLEVNSYGAMSPRELGSFALLVGRDLHLDGKDLDDFADKGDVRLPMFNSKVPGPGIVFMSPVFVNRNIHLPFVPPGAGGHKAGFNVKHSPVTFADRVILGRGEVYEGTSLYKPETAGARDDMLWSDNKLFGGFKMGVLVDGFADKGMNIFARVATATPVSDAFMQQCNLRYNALTDLATAKTSIFYGIRRAGSMSGTQTYDLSFQAGNPFKKDGGAFIAANDGAWTPGTFDRTMTLPLPDNATSNAVLKVAVQYGTGTSLRTLADLQLRKNTDVNIVPPLEWTNLDAQLAARKIHLAAKDPATLTPDEQIELDDTHVDGIKLRRDAIALWKTTEKPGLRLRLKKVMKASAVDGVQRDQANQLEFEVEVLNPHSWRFDVAAGAPDTVPVPFPTVVEPRLELLAYDGLHDNTYGELTSMTTPTNFINQNKKRYLIFAHDGSGGLTPPQNLSTTTPVITLEALPADTFDYADLDERCRLANNAATGQSFGAVEWNIDLADKSTFKSWNYADVNGNLPGGSLIGPDDVVYPEFTFTEAGNKWFPLNGPRNVPSVNPVTHAVTINRDNFRVHSILGECRITGKAQLVTGFFTCHDLYIEPRAAGYPLYIIGTFIVRRMKFVDVGGTTWSDTSARAAAKEGINWMSIYHPEAALHLRHAGVLRPKLDPTAECKDGASTADKPIWAQSAIKISRLSDNRACNVVSLRTKSNPLQWTAVDPDCGLLPLPDGSLSSATVCKQHPVNFFVMEHARGGGP